MFLKSSLLHCLCLFGFSQVRAQNTCVDSNYINIFYQGCPRDVYNPVCACGVTYFNQCAAEMQYGVRLGQWTSGVCGTFDFDFYPNCFVLGQMDYIRFFIQFQLMANNTATFLLSDSYGKVHDRRYINTLAQQEAFQYNPPPNLKNGVYFLIVHNDREMRVKKMVLVRGL